jgi:Protein of unknown function (DUF1501)
MILPALFRIMGRREFLRIGGVVAASASSIRAGRAAGEGFGCAKSVVLVYCGGGQSQLEMWDPKPQAPVEVRGEFDSIETALPGVRFGEHIPRIARLADRFTVIRSVSHDDLDHGSATYLSLTGRPHPVKSSNPAPSPNDYPTYGALLKRVRPSSTAFETAMYLNGPVLVPVEPSPGQDAGFLGRAFEPMQIRNLAVPLSGALEMPEDLPTVRVDSRRSLLESIETSRRAWAAPAAWGDMGTLYRRAYELLENPACRRAFDLENEPHDLREAYGRFRSGQWLLLARRLVEAGIPWINVFWNHSARGQDDHPDDVDSYGWDTHNDIFTVLRDHLLPRFDQSFATFLEDMDRRGLLDTTLVVCMGEFGRAPRVAVERRFAGNAPGRKHWANVYSVVMAGAGVSRGAVLGTSDRLAAYPIDERVGPWDLAATMFAALGVDPASEVIDPLGRPFALTTGKPISRLYS